MMKLARRRRETCRELAGSSFVNAALSTRLQHAPERLFWSGLVSYLDVLQLAKQIRAGSNRARDARLRQIGSRISALALHRDAVVPGREVTATLRGEGGDIPISVEVTDFPYAYSHEDPFPATGAGVDGCFRRVFSFASGCLA